MPLPHELVDVEEETALVGDVEAFMTMLQTGQMAEQYDERLRAALEELEQTYRMPERRERTQIVNPEERR